MIASSRRHLTRWAATLAVTASSVGVGGCRSRCDPVVGAWRVDWKTNALASQDAGTRASANEAEALADAALGPQTHWLVVAADGTGCWVDERGVSVALPEFRMATAGPGRTERPPAPPLVFEWERDGDRCFARRPGESAPFAEGVIIDGLLYVRDQIDEEWNGWNRWIFRRDPQPPMPVWERVLIRSEECTPRTR